MRAAPTNYDQLLSSAVLRPAWEVTSWLGGRYLGSLPVKSCTITETAADPVTGQLNLTVPNVAQWRPTSSTSTLGWYGQQVRVRTGWRNALGRPLVWFDLGRFRIRKPLPAGDVLQVRGDSLHQLVVNARFAVPVSLSGSTFRGRVQALLKGILPVSFDLALPDRPVKAQTYERERIDALTDTLSAWPAQLEILPSGVARITTPWESRGSTPVATYHDGDGGTVVDVAPEGNEDDDVPNAVVASTEPGDSSAALTEVAYTTAGPLRWGGPYGYLPAFYSSPLLTSRAQLRVAAATRLASLQRVVTQAKVTMVGDGRLQLGDVIRVQSGRRGTETVGRVTAVTHGLTPEERVSDITLSVLTQVPFKAPVRTGLPVAAPNPTPTPTPTSQAYGAGTYGAGAYGAGSSSSSPAPGGGAVSGTSFGAGAYGAGPYATTNGG